APLLDELSRRRATLAARRRRVPRADRRDRAQHPLAAGAADRRRPGVPRRAVLRHRPEDVEAMIELRDVSVRLGSTQALDGVSLSVEAGGGMRAVGPTAQGK